jgi:DNA mismatch repair protein MSH3
MGFLEIPADDGSASSNVVFLYKLTSGIAARSYGLNVARLARLPENMIEAAEEKAKEAQEGSEQRETVALARRFREVWV